MTKIILISLIAIISIAASIQAAGQNATTVAGDPRPTVLRDSKENAAMLEELREMRRKIEQLEARISQMEYEKTAAISGDVPGKKVSYELNAKVVSTSQERSSIKGSHLRIVPCSIFFAGQR
ncbi:MAG: hypothetical protein IPO77_16480 [Acidobacteria bacterium]|nr:hypothetical protein [Acidobacteriota bacterium]